jgi:hypothetical protein
LLVSCLLRADLQVEDAASLHRDEARAHECLDSAMRDARRERRRQDPDELVGRVRLLQEGERYEIQRLGLIAAMWDEDDDVGPSFSAVLEEPLGAMSPRLHEGVGLARDLTAPSRSFPKTFLRHQLIESNPLLLREGFQDQLFRRNGWLNLWRCQPSRAAEYGSSAIFYSDNTSLYPDCHEFFRRPLDAFQGSIVFTQFVTVISVHGGGINRAMAVLAW